MDVGKGNSKPIEPRRRALTAAEISAMLPAVRPTELARKAEANQLELNRLDKNSKRIYVPILLSMTLTGLIFACWGYFATNFKYSADFMLLGISSAIVTGFAAGVAIKSKPRVPRFFVDGDPYRGSSADKVFEASSMREFEGQCGRPFFTLAIVALIIVVFFITAPLGDVAENVARERLIKSGANFGPSTVNAGWWRLLASVFMHGSVWHLGLNILSLIYLGRYAETLLGRVGMMVTFLLCGWAGSVASLLWHLPPVVSVGASGAIYGLFGSVIIAAMIKENRIVGNAEWTLIGALITFIVLGYLNSMQIWLEMDHAAHVGGFAMGIFCGAIAARAPGETGRKLLYKDIVLAGVALAVMAATPSVAKTLLHGRFG